MELAVKIKGEIVSSNFTEFATGLRNSIKLINRTLETDDHFIQAKSDIANLKLAEDALKKVKELALAEAKSIQELFSAMDEVSEDARQARLDLDKMVKAQEQEVKESIVMEALSSIDRDIHEVFLQRIMQSIKGKRSIATIREAAENEVIIINKELKNSREVIARFTETNGSWIAPDSLLLELNSARELESTFAVRVAEKLAKDAKQEAKELEEKLEKSKEVEKVEATPEPIQTAPEKPATVSVTPKPVSSDIDKAELEVFLNAIVPVFRQFKQLRETTLKNPENIKLAGDMAESLNSHYIAMKGLVK